MIGRSAPRARVAMDYIKRLISSSPDLRYDIHPNFIKAQLPRWDKGLLP